MNFFKFNKKIISYKRGFVSLTEDEIPVVWGNPTLEKDFDKKY